MKQIAVQIFFASFVGIMIIILNQYILSQFILNIQIPMFAAGWLSCTAFYLSGFIYEDQLNRKQFNHE